MTEVTEIGRKLSELAEALKATGNKSRFFDNWNWQSTPLNVDDLAMIAESLSVQFSALNINTITLQNQAAVDRMYPALEIARHTTVPNLFGGPQAAEALITLFYAVEVLLHNLSPDADLKMLGGLSLKLRNRATQAIQRIEEAVSSIDGIEQKLTNIEQAHDAAEELPFTQAQLAEALVVIEQQQRTLQKLEVSAAESAEKATANNERTAELVATAESYLEKIQGAYRAVTSQGLAQAFKAQQESLNRSMLLWVFLLLASLSVAGLIAHERFPHVAAALSGKPDWGIVVIHLVLSVLSLSAPVWFAWVATTQIGQRFRLSEDYAYKAAISAAYEGYRTEAARLDPLLEAQLCASDLGRLDELPLRLIDNHVSGSPFHEFLRSSEFKQAAAAVPGLTDRAIALLHRFAPGWKSSSIEGDKTPLKAD